MLNFINNWARPIELASGTETALLDLPDGEYLLTIADSPTAASRWEIVRAEVDGGVATLQRGQEETLAQAWPEGSVIYCSVTAGALNEIMQSGGAAPGGGWGKVGFVVNYETAGVVSYTLSPTDVDVYVGSGGVGYDVELAIPEDLPPGAAMRVPVTLSMYWGSSLLIRAPGPLEVAITSGVAATALEDNGRVLRMLFEDGPGFQALLNMDLSVDRDGDYYHMICALRERPEEIYLSDQPVVDH